MQKFLVSLVFVFFTSNLLFGQVNIQWDKSFGTSDDELITKAIISSDQSAILITGYSELNQFGEIQNYNGEVNKNGRLDFLLLKLDLDGNLIWEKSYGGSEDEIVNSIVETKDGGFLLGGFSESNTGGDKSENSRGNRDYWIVKIDGQGNVIWDKTYGGAGWDELHSIEKTSNGDFFLVGTSVSNISGDKSEDNRGTNGDYWVVKIDGNGNKIWDKTYGGSVSDIPDSCHIREDDSLVIVGTSNSNAGHEKSENSRGERDFWLIAIDVDGNLLWDKTYGGASHEFMSDFGFHNSNIIIPSQSNSGFSGDKSTSSFGQGDGWILSLNESGEKLYDKSYGGVYNEGLNDVAVIDGSFLFCGSTRSYKSGNIDATSNGQGDFWIVKTNSQGNRIWDLSIGGEGSEFASEILTLDNGDVFVLGQSNGGPSGTKTAINHGGSDIWVVKVKEPRPFITTWKTDNTGTSEDNQITIPTFPGATYDYIIDWGDGTSNSGVTGNITHSYATPGIYQVSISGDFPRVYFANQRDKHKILNVTQWGDNVWLSMESSFMGCSNLDIVTSDTPNLTSAMSMRNMFAICTSLVGNESFKNWDASNITNMQNAFGWTTSFNQDISTWDVSNVTNMNGMFTSAILFNQPIGSWNVGKVVNMDSMFNNADSFNKPLNEWNVSNVESMYGMFNFAESFDQDLSQWNIAMVTRMNAFFSVSGLSDENYDKTLIGWANMSVLQDGVIFDSNNQYCQARDARQDLIGTYNWNISDQGEAENCTFISELPIRINAGGSYIDNNGETFIADTYFNTGSTLDRPQTGLPEPYQTFRFSRSQEMSYEIPLEDGEYTVNLYFAELWFGATGGGSGGVGSRVFDVNIEGELAEDNLDVFAEVGADAMLMKSHTVTVTGGVLDIDFDSRDAVGGERHPIINAIEILGAEPQEERPFVTTWKTDNPGASEDNQITIPTFSQETYDYTVDWGDGTSDSGVTGDMTHIYEVPGSYQISIFGDFPRIYFNNEGDKEKLLLIEQWGDVEWTSMAQAFFGCSNLNAVATDIPDLNQVTTMSQMFRGCESLVANSSIASWDVSNVTNTLELFAHTNFFNQEIGNWDVSNVDFMPGMFYQAIAFNGDITNWDVSKVYNMNSMFTGATSFNQNIGQWNVSSLLYMGHIFKDAISFNQDISSWNVSQVTTMDFAFQGALSFNQNLGVWNVGNVDRMFGLFSGIELSSENYDGLLNGWGTQQLQNGVTFNGGNSQYCLSEGARQKLIDDFGWTITDGGKVEDCVDPNAFITTWKTDNPGISEDNQITIHKSRNVLVGPYDFIVDWGDGNVDYNVTDDITHTYDNLGIYQISISGEFPAISFGIINGEQKDNLKLLEINQWGSQQWSDLNSAFDDCENLDILATDVPDLTDVSYLGFTFRGCNSLVYNSSINNWDVSNINYMWSMFSECNVFNQDISNWDVSNVIKMDGMFNFSGFNQDIGNWDVSSVNSMNQMFFDSPFHQDIGDWDVSNVTDMSGMFRLTPFNHDIGGWNVSNVTDISGMFDKNGVFNQSLENWDTSKVVYMSEMFNEASSFNQNIGNWNVENVINMFWMFKDTGLSIENYDGLLNGWSAQQLQSGVTFDGGHSQYCQGDAARQKIIDDFGWTITDAGKSADCPEPSDFALRINTGGTEIAYGDNVFGTDNYFNTGSTLDRPQTGLPEPYQSFRFSRSQQMSYDIPLEDGEYIVNLYFAELWFGATGGGSGGAGSRVFDVSIEGELAEDNLDVFAEAGADAMLMKSHTVTVTGGVLDIDFDSRDAVGGERHPIINAIEILGQVTEPEERPFVTTWKTDNPGTSEDNQITIPTFSGETYNYTVDWGDGNSDSSVTGDITHTYVAPGTYNVSISGDFPRIYFNNYADGVPQNGDENKILSVDQWGDITWSSMRAAFAGCSNLDVSATDIPNLNNVTDLSAMFRFCPSLVGNPSMGQWDISKVATISSLFDGASSFNQDIGDWNLSNVETISALFQNAESFNQDIGSWNVSNVKYMDWTFLGAKIFNQDISNWEISNTISLHATFGGTMFFNQDISSWDLSNVQRTDAMFSGAEAFNQDISAWNVSNVTTMNTMFFDAKAFNQDIGGWDVSRVTDMNAMFERTLLFNQDISGWDVSSVSTMQVMFADAGAFDQNIGGWNIEKVVDMSGMLRNSVLSTENYDNLLSGWSAQQLVDGVTFNAGNSQYCLGEEARQKLIDDFGWTITDGGKSADCPDTTSFITTWKTDNPGVSEDNQITIPTHPNEFYNYNVDWGDGTSNSGVTGNILHTYEEAGTYQVAITGVFPRIAFVAVAAPQDDVKKIISVDQWGSNAWSSMSYAFADCSELDIKANDLPDLSNLVDMQNMFSNCSSLIGNTSMNNWDISNVKNIGGMFSGASSFNQDIGSWDVSNVVYMNGMFSHTNLFNQLIGDWNVGNVKDMGGMFVYADAFNQYIGDWNVQNVTNMTRMFDDADSFNQNLQNWNVGQVVNMSDLFKNSGLSDENYNKILLGWSQLPILKDEVQIDAPQNKYCQGEEARQKLIDDFDWTITDAGKNADCPDSSDFALRINTGGTEVDYNGETFITDSYFNTGSTLDRPQTGLPEPFQSMRFSRSQQMNYDIPLEDGEYTVNLYFAELWFGATGGGAGGVGSRVFDVSIEGQLAEDNLDVFAEVGADGMLMKSHTITVTGGVLDIDFDSRDAVGGERHPIINAIEILGQISGPVERPFVTTWKTDNIGISEDNQVTIDADPQMIYDYNVDWGDGSSNQGVTSTITHTYGQPGTYTVSISGDFPRMSWGSSGSRDRRKLLTIESWGSIEWETMENAFIECSNLDVLADDTPDLSGVQSFYRMFWNCGNLKGNESFGDWDMSNATTLRQMFSSSLFNENIGNWNVSQVTNMLGMFNNTPFNQDIGGWNVDNVVDMQAMFLIAGQFNQDLSGWNVNSVSDMSGMFWGASSFNQNLGAWNISNVTDMSNMFKDVTLSTYNYDGILSDWSTQNLGDGVTFDGGNSQYCQCEAARQKLIDDFGWTITDAGKATDCQPPSSDEFWLEAECANVGANWSTINSASASGGQYLLPPAGANYNTAPTDPESAIRFDIDAEAGIYKIYARVSVPSEEDDSFWVRVNGESWLRWNLIPGSANFSWHQVHDRELNTAFLTFDLVDGSNTIEIAHREDGAGLDKLYVTKTSDVPTGLGQTDENCNSGSSSKRAIIATNAATLSPNPVVTTTTLSFEKPVELTTIQVFDVTGRLVHTYDGRKVADNGAYLLNVNELPTGTYFINSLDVNGLKHQKQMVIKK